MTSYPWNKPAARWFILLAIPFLIAAAWCSIRVYKYANERARVMEQFSAVNDVYYGLLSVNAWEEQLQEMVQKQIRDFELTDQQDSLLRVEISQLLYDMLDELEKMIRDDDGSFKKKLRKVAVNVFVDKDELRDKVPGFTDRIMQNLTSEASKERLKGIASEQLDQFTSKIYDNRDSLHLNPLFELYGVNSRPEFNEAAKQRAAELSRTTYNYAFTLLGIAALFLFAWFPVMRRPVLQKPLFLSCVMLGFIVLLAGLASPMIEIDARIAELDLVLLDQHIRFSDQIIFYRSKSILDVVHILINTGKFDSMLVGVLILAFSVILPISKLSCNALFLLVKKIRNNKLIHWLAYKSGKWSMADVMVVAIFMSYVGFSGILDDQLSSLDRDMETITSITTNLTSLRPGFYLFLAFVIFSLVLSTLLKEILKKEKKLADQKA
ncbi:MAG: paraquat-inducible protein A [Owenweeksia sp.]